MNVGDFVGTLRATFSQRELGPIRVVSPSGRLSSGVAEPAQEIANASLQIHTPKSLRALVDRTNRDRRELIAGLIGERSVNLLVGDSGLGKTPLAIQMGVCVAGARQFLGRDVQQGRVLYCDAETNSSNFLEMLDAISNVLGFTEPPPDFRMWSPYWESDRRFKPETTLPGEQLYERVRVERPRLVIVDPLRLFWSQAETKNAEAADLIRSLKELTRATGTSWLILHHRRKANQQFAAADLVENPHGWFQEAAGSHALINNSDTRLGVLPRQGQVDLTLAGFARGTGQLTPLDLARVVNDEGVAVGYKLLEGIEHLNPDYRRIFEMLPARFRFKDASAVMGGTSASNTTRLLDKCCDLRVLVRDGRDYVKVAPEKMPGASAVERVEAVE